MTADLGLAQLKLCHFPAHCRCLSLPWPLVPRTLRTQQTYFLLNSAQRLLPGGPTSLTSFSGDNHWEHMGTHQGRASNLSPLSTCATFWFCFYKTRVTVSRFLLFDTVLCGLREKTLKTAGLSSNPGSATAWAWSLRHIGHLSASVSAPVKRAVVSVPFRTLFGGFSQLAHMKCLEQYLE